MSKKKNKVRLERLTEKDGNKRAKFYGITSRKMNGMGYNSWPDRYYVGTKNRDLYVEYKKVGKEPTPLQLDTINDLRRRGKRVLVVDDNNLEELYAALASLVA